MGDELQENLKTYKLQLQQVEASLTTDPDNEDLQKLKGDLQEVIDLTQELISGKAVGAGGSGGEGASGSTSAAQEEASNQEPQYAWKVGDQCMAVYSEDGMYYEATIEEILDDGACTITFTEYGNTDVSQVSLLKPVDEGGRKRGAEATAGGPDAKKIKSKKDLIAEQREYKRKKSQKKAQRLKQMEEERETEKNKWIDFNVKTFSKTNKGKVKKSIFATPDGVKGKVGVGTCGVSGRPMTAYQLQEKWKK